MTRILVTGSEGLIGTQLCAALAAQGWETVHFDLRGPNSSDVRELSSVRQKIAGCEGVVHLAAIARVVRCEEDPAACVETNVTGTAHVIRAALESPLRPWFLFASSREVYGRAKKLPVSELDPLAPINVYGRAKSKGESMTLEARERGARTAVVRLSNVYGGRNDHPDRVVPAFVRAALEGRALRVEGESHTFDFTHVSDVVRGLVAVVRALSDGETQLPPVHFLTGCPTTLRQLAEIVLEESISCSGLIDAPGRSFDVEQFFGDPRRARELFGWSADISIRGGIRALVESSMSAATSSIQLERTCHDARK